jgi:low temperature requirement protein LtrA
VTQARPFDLLRERAGAARVTNVELFFDLVYVFAVTQLPHHLLHRPTLAGAVQTAILLAMVWLAWAYTAWVTNWLDPERIPVRLLLIALALVSLVMSAALPTAFGRWGLVVGGAYAVMQAGRSLFVVIALRGKPLRVNFQRILAWCVASGALAVLGGIVTGPARGWTWLAAVAVDLLGGVAGALT